MSDIESTWADITSAFPDPQDAQGTEMNDHRLLMTGDFWHSDFQSILSSLETPITLVPIGKIESVAKSDFDLIVIAQSHRDQIEIADIDRIHQMFEGTPIVALLGSWCEGEVRSGHPWPGVVRVYWHQWAGRFEAFLKQFKSGDSGWESPRTATVGDRILAASGGGHPEISSIAAESLGGETIGISAWTSSQHEMLADAISHFGWTSHWIERETMDGQMASDLSVICVEADSWSPELNHRLQWIKKEVSSVPMVLVLNYPREGELDEIRSAGVSEVVSKPFELTDLKSAIVRASNRQNQSRLGVAPSRATKRFMK